MENLKINDKIWLVTGEHCSILKVLGTWECRGRWFVALVGLTKYIIMPDTGAGGDDWKESDIISNFASNKADMPLEINVDYIYCCFNVYVRVHAEHWFILSH